MLTPKQERFCISYVETGNASEAYRQAYNTDNMKPESVNRKAKELIDIGKITARVKDIQAPAVIKAQMTLEGHLQDLQALRDAASATGQYSAAISAEVNRGKASGLYIDRLDIGKAASSNIQVLVMFGKEESPVENDAVRHDR